MSTAGHPDALVRRIEQLAASSADEPEGAALAALVGALRSEMSAVRADVGSVRAETAAARADLDGLGGRLAGSVAAGRTETGDLSRRLADHSGALEDARGALEARLAVLEDVLDALSERIEALARDGAGTTTELLTSVLHDVRGVDRRVEAVDARAAALEDRLLGRLADVLAERDEALRAEVLSGVERALSAATAAVTAEVADRSHRQLADVEGRLTAAVAELGTTFRRSLADVAGEVDVAATTTRDASARVAALAELGDLQRAEVERLLQVVQDRLAAVDAAVAEDATATSRVAEGLTELAAATGRLEETVGGFRAEWPTRTYEVVEGARAVAQGVVLDVREEVAARLEQVRAVLASAVQGVEQARSGLDGGTDRLAQAGSVLVGYLEQRDRLLEAERDRVLHDVLESFAAGLSARERGALAGRVSDAVSRRRDARDAERYRTAVGEPVAPTVALPEPVRGLVPPDADGARAQAQTEAEGKGAPEGVPVEEPSADTGRDQPAPRPAVRTGTAVARPAAARPAPGGSAVLPGPGKRVPAPGAAGAAGGGRPAVTGALAAAARQASEERTAQEEAPAEAPARATRRARAPRASAKAAGAPAAKGRAARPRPAQDGPATEPPTTADAGDAASRAAGPTPPPSAGARPAVARPGDRRGRLDAMPEVPSVAVALDAAAPHDAAVPRGSEDRSAQPDGDGGDPPAGPSAG